MSGKKDFDNQAKSIVRKYISIGLVWILIKSFIDIKNQEFNDSLILYFIDIIFLALTTYLILEYYKMEKELIEPLVKHSSLEEKLEFLKSHDEETGFYNKQGLMDKIERILEENSESNCTLLYLQIDSYRARNDLYRGEDIDRLINQAGKRMDQAIKLEKVMAKISDFEYVVIIQHIGANIQEFQALISGIIEELDKPFLIDRQYVNLHYKIGVSRRDNLDDNYDSVLRKAQFAVYNIIDQPNRRYELYREEIERKLSRENYLIKEMEKAIEDGSMVNFYQPIININTGKIVGLETLVRWINKDEIFISPGEFIPLSEKTGQIHEITDLVIENALKQKMEWKEKGYKDLFININISSKSIGTDNFIDKLKDCLIKYDINPSEVILEITETSTIDEFSYLINEDFFKELKAIGLSIALDDFGTGNSTLARLNTMPVDYIKLDRSFIVSLEDEGTKYVVEAIANLSNKLGLGMIAEGIETKEQLDSLIELGFELGQGYFLARPADARTIELMFDKDFT